MNIEQLLPLRNDFALLPISINFKLTAFDPLAILREFETTAKPSFVMTCKPKQSEDGYTFICLNPEASYTYKDGQLTVDHFVDEPQIKNVNLHQFIDKLINQHRAPKMDELPPFVGGLVGYFSYDYAKYATSAIIEQVDNPNQLDDADLMLVKTVVGYNHATNQVTISKLVDAEKIEQLFDKTVTELTQIKQRIINLDDSKPINSPSLTPLQYQFSLPEFSKRVAKTQQHIIDGDIFQLILSNPQNAQIYGSLLEMADRFFKQNPSPYHFYFHHNDFESMGASPETLITKKGSRLFSYPLAGTRKRGKNVVEDNFFAHELQTNEKELSEHNMLIDLGRNDLGRISKFGSVKVVAARKLLKFANVMHLGSIIESTITDKTTTMDIVDSVLPAGTLSGAPKVSAMQIIAQLEGNKRGIYGGGIGYLGFDGDLDLCIGIRLVYRKRNQLVIHSGAGIVANSIAKYEYQEFNNKASGVVNSLYPISKEKTAHEFSN